MVFSLIILNRVQSNDGAFTMKGKAVSLPEVWLFVLLQVKVTGQKKVGHQQ